MHNRTLEEHAEHHKVTDKPPKPDELMYILARYFETTNIVDMRCKDIARHLQQKYKFWNGSKAKDIDKAADDAVSALCVYGIESWAKEYYSGNNRRRVEFEQILGANIRVSAHNNRTFTLIPFKR